MSLLARTFCKPASLSLWSMHPNQEHVEGEEQKILPGFVREKCGVTITHHCLPQQWGTAWEAGGEGRRTRRKRKGGSNFNRKEKLTLNYCFISGSIQVSDMLHPTPRDATSAPKQRSKEEKDLKGSCPKKEPFQDLDLQRSLLVKRKYPAKANPPAQQCLVPPLSPADAEEWKRKGRKNSSPSVLRGILPPDHA